MSLPSSAFFVKDGLIVGKAFCNCGWFLNGSSLLSAAERAWQQAKDIVNKGTHEKPVENLTDGERQWYDGYIKWYTTREDLLTFDSVHLYGYMLPRDALVTVQRDPSVEPKLAEIANKGLYKDEGQLKAAIDATKIARGIQ